eukprot:30904-Pelagococcus_subviridis.AAC.5
MLTQAESEIEGIGRHLFASAARCRRRQRCRRSPRGSPSRPLRRGSPRARALVRRVPFVPSRALDRSIEKKNTHAIPLATRRETTDDRFRSLPSSRPPDASPTPPPAATSTVLSRDTATGDARGHDDRGHPDPHRVLREVKLPPSADEAHPGKFDWTYNVDSVLRATVPNGKGWAIENQAEKPIPGGENALWRKGAFEVLRTDTNELLYSKMAEGSHLVDGKGGPEGKLGSFINDVLANA